MTATQDSTSRTTAAARAAGNADPTEPADGKVNGNGSGNGGADGESTADSTAHGLLVDAQAAVSTGANALRDIRERYRAAHTSQVDRWEKLRKRVARSGRRNGNATEALRRDEAVAGREVGKERSTLTRIDLAIRSLESAWLFLNREDDSLVMDPSDPSSAADVQMRIIEAQEAERSRLAREVHDGPAQALANGIFQVEVVERLLDRDEMLARAELRLLRDILNRELRSVRAYLSQLRPPLLADLGLNGAISDAAQQVSNIIGAPVAVDLDDGLDDLPETVEIVILRVIQEALQNVRKHAAATSVRVRVAREGNAWTVEVRDDGRGFDPDAAPVAGRRNFGLQFMRERADLIGARFEVRSRPDLGTVVRMAIPAGTEDS
jgi:two-component system, NarL family, sensor histidine kinase DegS